MIEKGALAHEDRPLWYDVYKAFPPRVDPTYDRQCPTNAVRNILYPEDRERSLRELHPNASGEELMSLAEEELRKEGVMIKRKPDNTV
ncbi:unnamed protein product [Trichobilharzia regenti]|nr:unnamed protein product [Trichobilharzia regenti]